MVAPARRDYSRQKTSSRRADCREKDDSSQSSRSAEWPGGFGVVMERKSKYQLVSAEWIQDALLRISSLSPQQLVVLRCLAAGMDNRSIATIMGRTERTIKAHVSALIERLHVESRLQLGLVGYHAILLANPHLLTDSGEP